MNQEIAEVTKIAIFRDRKIRKTIYQNEWWFVVEDVVVALTDSSNPKDYINKMRLRDNELSKGYGQIVHTLPIETAGGKQKMNCANTEGIFRIIQSIPSPKAEPFKVVRRKSPLKLGIIESSWREHTWEFAKHRNKDVVAIHTHWQITNMLPYNLTALNAFLTNPERVKGS